jgi:excisionase family DNA binding protein
MTVQAVADRLGVHKQSIYRLVWDKSIGFTRVGRAIRIPVAAYDKYLKDFSTAPAYATTSP